jgi:hypothetical protein
MKIISNIAATMKATNINFRAKTASVVAACLLGGFYVPTAVMAHGGGECGDEYGVGYCGGGWGQSNGARACGGGATGIRNVWNEIMGDPCGGASRTWEEYQCNGQGGAVLVRSGTVVIGTPCPPPDSPDAR